MRWCIRQYRLNVFIMRIIVNAVKLNCTAVVSSTFRLDCRRPQDKNAGYDNDQWRTTDIGLLRLKLKLRNMKCMHDVVTVGFSVATCLDDEKRFLLVRAFVRVRNFRTAGIWLS